MTIGVYGKMTIEQARDQAKQILAKAELGQDVAAERAKVRAEMTVVDLCDVYLTEIQGLKQGLKKESTVVADRGRIARHIKPLLGAKRIGEVTRPDVERFMRDVANGKTAVDVKTGKRGRAIVTGGRGTATRTIRLLGGIFTFAIDRQWRTDNPTTGVKKHADQKGERFLSNAELERLGAAIREAETISIEWQINDDQPGAKHLPKVSEARRSKIGPHAAAAIRLLILTGCRLREILNLEWRQVDFERGILLLPDSKTGAKAVILGASALAILSEIPREGTFVIAGHEPDKPRTDLKRPWTLVTRAADLPDLRLHDLRHTFASVGAAGGPGLTVVGTLLGHSAPKTTKQYSHFHNDPLQRAATSIGVSIAATMGDVRSHENNLVPIRGVGGA